METDDQNSSELMNQNRKQQESNADDRAGRSLGS